MYQDPQQSGRSAEPKLYYAPLKRNCWQSTREFVWNPRNHTVCSRTPLNWLAITIYYAIFLAVVFAILYGSLQIVGWVAKTTNPDAPRFSYDESPIGTTPGVNFVPLNNKVGPLLRLDDEVDFYINRIDDFLSDYKSCNGSHCFNVSNLADCGVRPYGYGTSEPCVYVKLNRLIQWIPEPYVANDTFPDDMPKELQDMIKSSTDSKIWVFCQGEMPLDRDHVAQKKFTFRTEQGFDPSVFPYSRQKNFIDPIVAFKINVADLKSILYAISCSAWAKNADSEVATSAFLLYA